MLRRSLFVALLVALAVGGAWAGTITRGTKVYGGTAFKDGEILSASELNTDLDNIYIEFNGSIDANNLADNSVGAAEVAANSVGSVDIINDEIVDADVNSAANIDPSKIGDYSANAAEMDNQTSPGTTGSESLPTTLEGELERLRYTINRLAHGSSATSAAKSWIDPPIRGSNILYNGDFEITDGTGSTSSTTVASGWSNLNTATIAYAAATDVSEGEGVAMRTTAAGGADEGASQTLANLKASTPYLFIARVKPTAGDTCDLQVTGGAATVTDTSAGSGSYETLAVIATTNATPSNLVLRLESNVDTDVCDWDHIGAYELNNDPIPNPGIQAIYTTNSTADSGITGTFADTAILSTSITIPGPGYIVQIDAALSIRTNNDLNVVRLARDDCAGGAFSAVSPVHDASSTVDSHMTIPINYIDTNRTPGTTCIYRVEVADAAADGTASTVNPIVSATQTGSSLRLMLIPPGGG